MKKVLIAISALAVMFAMSGCTKISQYRALDDNAIPAYKKMFNTVLETGDAAKAMTNEYEVQEDVENDDVAESIYALAEEYNMRITGDIKMFTKDDAKPEEVKHARIFSLCSLSIAKKFLNHSRQFGTFMPCRIMLIELGNGKRYLETMDLTLAIYGGRPLPKEMLELSLKVEKAMTEIPARAAEGDF